MARNNGFTVIEIMVVCTVIVSIMGLTLARYNDFSQKKRLNQEAMKLSDVMAIAAKKALAADVGSACTDFQGEQVILNTNGIYSLKQCCEATCSSAQSSTISSYTLQAGIIVSSPTANTTYQFNKLNQTITITPAANTTVILKNTVTSKCLSLAVATTGVVTLGTEYAC